MRMVVSSGMRSGLRPANWCRVVVWYCDSSIAGTLERSSCASGACAAWPAADRLGGHLRSSSNAARSGQSAFFTVLPVPSRLEKALCEPVCAYRRTRLRRRSSAIWKRSCGGIGVFHPAREMFFRGSFTGLYGYPCKH
jgi:hypothetical protein